MKASTQFSVGGFIRASVLTVPIGPRPTKFFHFNLSPGRAVSLLLSHKNRKALDKDPYAFPMPTPWVHVTLQRLFASFGIGTSFVLGGNREVPPSALNKGEGSSECY